MKSFFGLPPMHHNFSFTSLVKPMILASIILMHANASAKEVLTDKFDKTIEHALQSFNTPGIAVGVIYKGEVQLAKGYGLAELERNQAVNQDTLFRLASTSKAFTAAALAVLVEQGKINWDSKVSDYLPNFKLSDTYASEHFTVVDLLTHRSGLVSGAGDSMIWPAPSGFSRQEVVQNLRFLQAEYSFRERYAYSNVLYVTAGELVSQLSGMSFEDFVQTYIFKALNMDCFVGDVPKNRLNNTAMAYGYSDERGIYAITRNNISTKGLMSAAAGGMVCNVSSMLSWANALISKDKLPFSNKQLNSMWQGHTLLQASANEQKWDKTEFKQYGLGWRISNRGKFKVVSHTGTLSGYQAYLLLVPEIELGIIILSNGSNSSLRASVMKTILYDYLPKYDSSFAKQQKTDWVKVYQDYWQEREQRYLQNYEAPIAAAPMTIADKDVVGVYKDKWFGDLTIEQITNSDTQKPDLIIYSSKMKTLQGRLAPFQANTYKITWNNKNAARDAFIHFSTNVKREVKGAQLHPFSSKELVNHEYRDMFFVKQ